MATEVMIEEKEIELTEDIKKEFSNGKGDE